MAANLALRFDPAAAAPAVARHALDLPRLERRNDMPPTPLREPAGDDEQD